MSLNGPDISHISPPLLLEMPQGSLEDLKQLNALIVSGDADEAGLFYSVGVLSGFER